MYYLNRLLGGVEMNYYDQVYCLMHVFAIQKLQNHLLVGCGVGIVLYVPDGNNVSLCFKLIFPCSNNEVSTKR